MHHWPLEEKTGPRREIDLVVLVLDKFPNSVRGELTRWLMEVKAGIFVGKVSARVREKLWEMVCSKVGNENGATMLCNADNEQGFEIRAFGNTTKIPVDYDGLILLGTKKEAEVMDT